MSYTLRHFGTSGLTFYAKPSPLQTATWGSDVVALAENGTTGEYTTAIASPADVYVVFVRVGASPAATDAAEGVVDFVAEKLALRVTDARAEKLDNLDATISSRASQVSVDDVQTSADAAQSAAQSAATQTQAPAIRAALGMAAGNLDEQLGQIAGDAEQGAGGEISIDGSEEVTIS